MENPLFKRTGHNQFKLVENANLPEVPQNLEATYKAVDGVVKNKIHRSKCSSRAQEVIDEWVGLNGDISEKANYIVADDGVGIVAVKGIDIILLLVARQNHNFCLLIIFQL